MMNLIFVTSPVVELLMADLTRVELEVPYHSHSRSHANKVGNRRIDTLAPSFCSIPVPSHSFHAHSPCTLHIASLCRLKVCCHGFYSSARRVVDLDIIHNILQQVHTLLDRLH